MSSKISLISSSVIEGLNSNVVSSHLGCPPIVNISFELIFTKYHPRLSDVNVIGSVFTKRYLLPISIAEASSPTEGPTTTLLSSLGKLLKSVDNILFGSFPVFIYLSNEQL